MRFKFLHRLVRVVDESKPSALASTVVRSESKYADLVFVGFVELGKLFSKFILGAVRSAGV
jgi:hypothetical protein